MTIKNLVLSVQSVCSLYVMPLIVCEILPVTCLWAMLLFFKFSSVIELCSKQFSVYSALESVDNPVATSCALTEAALNG